MFAHVHSRSRQYGAYASADFFFDIDSSKYNRKLVLGMKNHLELPGTRVKLTKCYLSGIIIYIKLGRIISTTREVESMSLETKHQRKILVIKGNTNWSDRTVNTSSNCHMIVVTHLFHICLGNQNYCPEVMFFGLKFR